MFCCAHSSGTSQLLEASLQRDTAYIVCALMFPASRQVLKEAENEYSCSSKRSDLGDKYSQSQHCLRREGHRETGVGWGSVKGCVPAVAKVGKSTLGTGKAVFGTVSSSLGRHSLI